MTGESAGDRFVEELKETAALLRTCRDRTPHALVVTLPTLAPRALGNASIYHAMTHLLFRVVVRRLNAGLEQESEIVPRHVVSTAVFALHKRESVGKRSRLRNIGRTGRDGQELVGSKRACPSVRRPGGNVDLAERLHRQPADLGPDLA